MDLSTVNENEKDLEQLEKVYIGAAIAKRTFPGLKTLHYDVLWALSELEPTTSVRTIRGLMDEKHLQIDAKGNVKWSSFGEGKVKKLPCSPHGSQWIHIEDGTPFA